MHKVRKAEFRWRPFVTPLVLLAGTPVAAQAQTAPAAEGQGLEEIVVTAQKRSESLQRTPLAISAVGADTIETRRITDASGLSAVAPSLSTAAGPGSRSQLVIMIRSVGETEPILTADSPVGVYVDGVILGRSTGAVFELVDLERIEVLRGPQGTLYGRNTTGGAVNIITRKPSNGFGVDMLGSIGNRGLWQGRASLDTGDIGDTGFKARVTYLHKQADGYVDNPDAKPSRDPGAYNTDAVRAALRFDRGGAFRFDYAFDWAETKGVIPMPQLTAATPDLVDYFSRSPAFGGTAFIPPSATRLGAARPSITPSYDRNISHSLTAEVDLTPSLTLRSITGFRQWKNSILATDQDGNSGLMGLVVAPGVPGVRPVDVFGADNHRRQHQFSQEFNAIGNLGDRFDYVAGAYYFREEAREDNPQHFTLVQNIPGVGLAGIDVETRLRYSTQSESAAVFGQGTYHFTDALSFTGGLRYTSDQRKLIQLDPLQRQLSRSFSKVNYAATLTYQATPDIMAYARVASGYKAGGFNARSINDGYDPENVVNYEVGLKSEFLGRRLRFNGTLFYTDLKDKQVTQFASGSGGTASQTINAGKVQFKGVEAEVQAIPFDGLQLNAAVGYTHQKFKELLAVDPVDDVVKNYADVAHLGQAPTTTLSAGAQYSIEDVAGGTLSFRLDYAYKSKQYFVIIPGPIFSPFDAAIAAPGYGLLDGRIILADVPLGGTEASFTLWGKNLTNKVYRAGGIDFGGLGFAVNIYGEPRSYGLDMRIKF